MIGLDLVPGATVTIGLADEQGTIDARLVKLLGRGGNGAIWLAEHEGEVFAIKELLRAEDDHELAIEQRIVEQFDHPCVVSLLGSGRSPAGRPLLAYERLFPNPLTLLARESVRSAFPSDPGTRNYPLPPPVALNLAVDLFSAIEHIHRRGFVHHDVKPDNLMMRVPVAPDATTVPEYELLELALEGQAQGVLVDLGSSRSYAYLAELNTGRFDDDLLVVPPQLTPIYAPPEALLPNEIPDGPPRALLLRSLDLYAAGLTLYSMVTGRAPYDHLNVDLAGITAIQEVKTQEREGKLFPVSAEAVLGALGYRRVADDLLALIRACTERDPAKRPTVGGAHEFVQEVQRSVAPAAGARRPFSERARALAAPPPTDVFFGVSAAERARLRAMAWELRRRPDGEE